jgi:hypothetical protein
VIKSKNKGAEDSEAFAMESTHCLIKIDPQVRYFHHLILCRFLHRFEPDQKPQAPRTSHQVEQLQVLGQRHGSLRQPAPSKRYHFGKELFRYVPVQSKGVIDEEDVRRINRLDLGDHLLNRPDAILLSQGRPDAAEFAIVRTPSGCLDADRDTRISLISGCG